MYKGKKIVITICARGGSKGIPGKNIKLLAGKPLIAYSIEAALKFPWADRIIVSTDDPKIKKVAEKCGVEVPFLRPKKLANDVVSRIDAFTHAAQAAEKIYQEKYDIVMDLGNVAPLRNQADMKKVVKLLVDTPDTNSVFTVAPSARNPYYNMVEVNDKGYAGLSKKLKQGIRNRQEAPKVYDMNDSIYAIWKEKLEKYHEVRIPKTRVVVMPEERSVDIDRPVDFMLVEALIKDRPDLR